MMLTRVISYVLLVGVGFSLLVVSCNGHGELPDHESEQYEEAVNAFFTGVAAIQAGEDRGAEEQLLRVVELAPGEPAAWANLGLLALRRNEVETARERLSRAEDLAPENANIQLILAQFEINQGLSDAAIARLRGAAEQHPRNVRVHYTLFQALERQAEDGWMREAEDLLTHMRALHPDSTVLILEQMRVAALLGDRSAVQDGLASLQEEAAQWPPRAREHFNEIAEAAVATEHEETATRVVFLKNVLRSEQPYRREIRALQTPPAEMGELLTQFVRLPNPEPTTAPADTSLTFLLQDTDEEVTSQEWIGAVHFGDEATPRVATSDRDLLRVDTLKLSHPGRPTGGGGHGIVALDYNYNFRSDLAAAGQAGLRLYEQDNAGSFQDVTERAFPAPAIADEYTGVWSADVDLDGDIDLILGRPDLGPLVLRNNGDGTFATTEPFGNIFGISDFTWADFRAEGAPDPAFLSANGSLHLMRNERRGLFTQQDLPVGDESYLALASADINQEGRIGLLALAEDGSIYRFSELDDRWNRSFVVQWNELPAGIQVGEVRLLAGDIDNNGALDIVISAAGESRVWINRGRGSFAQLAGPIEVDVFDIADVSGDGRLEMLGLDQEGKPQLVISSGEKNYNWQILRPRAAQTIGDQRINSFGIGGELEVRSGLAYQKLAISKPRVHVGLGIHERARLIRIVWPNGDVQAEFELQAGEEIETPQRLKGSCPWVFTFDGEGMQFVTDFIWRSPLGLSINAQETAGVTMTEDWIKIRGDQLVPRDGYYDVRITAELWETHFFDYIALLVVDRPADTEMFVDERFVFPPPLRNVNMTSPPQPVAHARDHHGQDVTDLVTAHEGRHLDTFDRTPYQGLAEEHFVEVDLGEKALEEEHLLLVASGWVRPTDSSINVALSQGDYGPPDGLTLEVPDGRGGWIVAKPNLGFPAGKDKTIIIDLEDVFLPDTPARLRLRTTMEIYWDALKWAAARPQEQVDTLRLAPDEAALRYRGFSEVVHSDRSRPEKPTYGELAGTAPRWRDLTGYYTRFGDVLPLLDDVDNRYVIMNAGDEMVLRFPAPDDPPPGWKRDFVLIGDGWVKDGDLNTAFSQTVRPLPSHDDPDYDTPPGALTEDPVYQRHLDDWKYYHTRFVTPGPFNAALAPFELRQ